MRTVLVTGATGFLGSYVLPELKKAGFAVRCLVRNAEDSKTLESMGALAVRGDVRARASLSRALKGVDVVLHMAAVVKCSSKQLYYDVNQRGTENLVAACTESGVKRFIHISTHDVTFERGDYSISKLRGEDAVRNSGLDFTILRPTAIYGRGECAFSGLVRSIKCLPVVPIPGKGDAKLQPVYAGDVAGAVMKTIGSKRTIGRTYFVAGPDQITFDELVNAIMSELGTRKTKLHVPLSIARLAAWILERLVANPIVTTDSLELLTCDKTCDCTPAAEDFGYAPTHFRDGIRSMLGADD